MTEIANHTNPKSTNFAGPCPRCGGGVPNDTTPGEYPGALSRYDNKTYICSACGTAEAFASGHMIPLSIDLRGPEAKAIREEVRYHDGEVTEGPVVECSCGWKLALNPVDRDAAEVYRMHILNAGSANFAHTDERHDNGARSDIEAWAALGCRGCRERLEA